jgi:hypothetical protein
MFKNFQIIRGSLQKKEKRFLPHLPLTALTIKIDVSSQDLKVEKVTGPPSIASLKILKIKQPEDFPSQDSRQGKKIFGVSDILGNVLHLRHNQGDTPQKTFEVGNKIKGEIHGNGRGHNQIISVEGKVIWTVPEYFGIKIVGQKKDLKMHWDQFNSLENLVKSLRPLHKLYGSNQDFPKELIYWLRSDGPLEILVWSLDGVEIEKIQIIYQENYIEWDQLHHIQTGIRQKNYHSQPTHLELDSQGIDHFVDFDHEIHDEKLQLAQKLLSLIDPELAKVLREKLALEEI